MAVATKVPPLPPELAGLVTYLDGLDRRMSAVEADQTIQDATVAGLSTSISGITSTLAIPNPFTKVLRVQEQTAQGVAGKSLPSATWTIRDLTTVLRSELSGGSVSAIGEITLAQGEYLAIAFAPCQVANVVKTRLYDTSHAMTLATSTNYRPAPTGNATMPGCLIGVFTLPAQSILQLQTNPASTGIAYEARNLTDEVEIGADLTLWKLS